MNTQSVDVHPSKKTNDYIGVRYVKDAEMNTPIESITLFKTWLTELLIETQIGTPSGVPIYLSCDHKNTLELTLQIIDAEFARRHVSKEFGIVIPLAQERKTRFGDIQIPIIIGLVEEYKTRAAPNSLIYITDRRMNESIDRFRQQVIDSTEKRYPDHPANSNHVEEIVNLFREEIGKSIINQSDERRTSFNDELDGFNARKKEYNDWYTKTHGHRPEPGSDEVYSVKDFLVEVWGDKIGTPGFKPSYIKKMDPKLYYRLISHQKCLKNACGIRKKPVNLTLKQLVNTHTISVRDAMNKL